MIKTLHWNEHKIKAKQQKNEFEKYYFRLMNNAVFGKKQRDIKLVTTEGGRKYLVSEKKYHTTKFSENIS